MAYKKIVYGTAHSQLTNIGNKYVRTTRFALISSGTSGTVSLPSQATVVLDDFGGTVDAVISKTSSAIPTFEGAVDGAGSVVATSFNSSGAYTLTGTPSAYPVAIIYRVQQLLKNFDSTSSNIVGGPFLAVSVASFPYKQSFTLTSTDITNRYVDLTKVAIANSVSVIPNGAPEQIEGTDYTVGLTGGVGGKTRITFIGDLVTGVPALTAGEIVTVEYECLG